MADVIDAKFRDLFEKKTFASLATVMPDGTPQVTPVWVDYDGRSVIVNSARGRQKFCSRRLPRQNRQFLDDERNKTGGHRR